MIEVKILGALKSILDRDRVLIDGKEIRVKELVKILKGVEEATLVIFVNGVEVSSLKSMETVVREGDRVEVLSTQHCSSFELDGQVGLVHGLRLKGDPVSTLEGLKSRYRGIIQLVDPSCVASELHTKLVLQQCFEAMNSGGLYAKKAEIDILLRLCCTDQIDEALKEAGAKREEVVLFAILSREDAEKLEEEVKDSIDDGILKPDKARVKGLMEKHGIGKVLLDATLKEEKLAYLLAESSALLKL